MENVPKTKKAKRLPQNVRLFIVRQFAQFQGIASIAVSLKKKYGLDVPLTTLEHYNGDNQSSTMGGQFRTVFNAERAAFLKSLDKQPIANQVFRLKSLSELHDEGKREGDARKVVRAIDLARKEAELLANVRGETGGVVEVRVIGGLPSNGLSEEPELTYEVASAAIASEAVVTETRKPMPVRQLVNLGLKKE